MLVYSQLMEAYAERCRGRIYPARLILSPANFAEYLRRDDIYSDDGTIMFHGSAVVKDPNEPNFRFEGEMVY
jgi:hypothetical protein